MLRYKRLPACSGLQKVVDHARRCTKLLYQSPRHSGSAKWYTVMSPYLSNLLIAANIGIMVFFTVAVAPTIFTVLPPQWSAAYVRKFFPKYFLFLGATTTAALALAFGGEVDWVHPWALLACALVFFLNCFWITPRINLARDDKQAATFKTLYWLSVGFNMVQLLIFVWLLLPTGRMP